MYINNIIYIILYNNLLYYIILMFNIIYIMFWLNYGGFPGNSAGKESACNAGDPSLIPRLGRFAGEGIGYPL